MSKTISRKLTDEEWKAFNDRQRAYLAVQKQITEQNIDHLQRLAAFNHETFSTIKKALGADPDKIMDVTVDMETHIATARPLRKGKE